MKVHSLTWGSADPAAVIPINDTSDVVVAAETQGSHRPLDLLEDPLFLDRDHMTIARLSPAAQEPVWIVEKELPEDEQLRGPTIWLFHNNTEKTVAAAGTISVNGEGICLRVLYIETDIGSVVSDERVCPGNGRSIPRLVDASRGYELERRELEDLDSRGEEAEERLLKAIRYDIDNWEEIWRFEWLASNDEWLLQHVEKIPESGDVVVSVGRQGEREEGSDAVLRINGDTGKVVWKNTTDWFAPGEVTVHAGVGLAIVVGSSNQAYRNLPVRAYDLRDGTLIWTNNESPSESNFFWDQAIEVDHDRGRLYYAAQLVESMNTFNPPGGIPIEILAIDLQNGSALWKNILQLEPAGTGIARDLIVDEATGRVFLVGQMQSDEGPGAFLQSYDGATGQRIAFWGDQAPDNRRSTLHDWHFTPESESLWMLVRDPEVGSGMTAISRLADDLR